jgi:glycosyltransferase involved in cell wall biosynthesis
MSNYPNNQTKIVLVAYYFPPKQFSGATRALNIANSLARAGMEVVVITPCPRLFTNAANKRFSLEPNVKVMETGHCLRILNPDTISRRIPLVGRIATSLGRRLAERIYHDSEIGWTFDLSKALKSLEIKPDAVIVTASPYSPISTVAKWCENQNIPFSIDYRDLLSGNPHSKPLEANKWIAKKESEWLKQAAAIVTVSQTWQAILGHRQRNNCPVFTITNGFDPADSCIGDTNCNQCEMPSLVYSGIFLPPKRIIDPIFVALRRVKASSDFRFHYFGHDGDYILRKAEEFGLQSHVINHAIQPRDIVLRYLQDANVSIVISSVEAATCESDLGILPAKLYEAMAFGIPVLGLGDIRSDLAEICRQEGIGACFSSLDIEGISSFILENCTKKNRYNPPINYSWTEIGKKYAAIVNEMTNLFPIKLRHPSPAKSN